MRRYGIRIIPLIIVGIIILFKFIGAEKVTNPVTGRKSRVAISSSQEEVLGLQSYQQVLSQSSVISSGPEVDQVVKVARRLTRVVSDEGKNFEWQVSVVRSDEVNAFCLPGGKIVVYTGILPVAQTEAGLATVLGHEMAHAVARHASQRLFESSIMQTAMAGVQFSLANMDYQHQREILGVLGAGAQYGVMLPFSRTHETEADEMGLIYMARAGYDPRESIKFWERMSKAGGRSPPEFMSTHPSHGSRIQRLEALMPKAVSEYEHSKDR